MNSHSYQLQIGRQDIKWMLNSITEAIINKLRQKMPFYKFPSGIGLKMTFQVTIMSYKSEHIFLRHNRKN